MDMMGLFNFPNKLCMRLCIHYKYRVSEFAFGVKGKKRRKKNENHGPVIQFFASMLFFPVEESMYLSCQTSLT